MKLMMLKLVDGLFSDLIRNRMSEILYWYMSGKRLSFINLR